MKRLLSTTAFLLCAVYLLFSQEKPATETNLAGVFKGQSLFVQNPYDRDQQRFCVEGIFINEKRVDINYRLSALKLDFDGFDLYTPVKIRIAHRDTLCTPIIINPEAILFHTIFRFEEISLTDSALVWSTKGETGVGSFEIARLYNGIWVDKQVVAGQGIYEGADYTYFPDLEEGANKYRIKYHFPVGSRTKYLYSWEFEYQYYPEPITFKPKSAKTRLYLSRSSRYEIYNPDRKLVLEGQGTEIDLTVLRRGDYVIFFNGKDPGGFYKE